MSAILSVQGASAPVKKKGTVANSRW
ncbi:type IV conjugative transfer system pilin TraA [Salmonella sp. NW1184]